MSESSTRGHEATSVSVWVSQWAHLIATGGTVLDLACGSGRHTRWLAARGHSVLAVDRDATALATLADLPAVETLHADLEAGAWPLPAQRSFAGVVVTNYLHRPLLAKLPEVLTPGGVLIYETFAAGNGAFGKPSNPDFLLRPGELLDAVRGRLRVVAFQDGLLKGAGPVPALIQRIVAVREPIWRSSEARNEPLHYTLLQL
jgi:SAM-dependent methyltransferase